MNSQSATPHQPAPSPGIEAPLANRITAIEELVASRYWSLLPQRVQDNWQRQLNDLRGQLPPAPCTLPIAPVICP